MGEEIYNAGAICFWRKSWVVPALLITLSEWLSPWEQKAREDFRGHFGIQKPAQLPGQVFPYLTVLDFPDGQRLQELAPAWLFSAGPHFSIWMGPAAHSVQHDCSKWLSEDSPLDHFLLKAGRVREATMSRLSPGFRLSCGNKVTFSALLYLFLSASSYPRDKDL